MVALLGVCVDRQDILDDAQIRDALRPHLDANDSLLVAALAGDWATLGLSSDWFRRNLAH